MRQALHGLHVLYGPDVELTHVRSTYIHTVGPWAHQESLNSILGPL